MYFFRKRARSITDAFFQRSAIFSSGSFQNRALAFEALAKSLGLTFTQGLPSNGAIAYLDEDRFEEVLGNVLSNAMKFTPAGGPRNGEPAVAPPELASTDAVFVERLRETVEQRLEDENFDIDALAAVLAIDRSHLYRRMIELTGRAPSIYLKMARLDRAADLPSARAGSVSEVAYASGFRSVSHFSRSFAERFGRSPSAYAAEQPS